MNDDTIVTDKSEKEAGKIDSHKTNHPGLEYHLWVRITIINLCALNSFSREFTMVSTGQQFALLALSVTLLQANAKAAGGLQLIPRAEDNGVDFEIGLHGDIKLTGTLGLSLPLSVGTAINCSSTDPSTVCYNYGDFAKLQVTLPNDGNGNCARVEWESQFARRLEDCFSVEGIHMYGGAESLRQYWPINEAEKKEAPYITGDFFNAEYGDVLENYWLFSTGAAVHVDESNPLFVSWNTVRPNQLCFVSADQYPYNKRELLTLKYDVCVGDDIKSVHQSTMKKYYKTPSSLPDETMLIRPLWSTWAQYKSAVNQTIVLDYAKRIIDEGFGLSSHIEIDDNWEPCYGTEEFDSVKFPNPKSMVDQIKAMNLRVTLWAHPFVNFRCDLFDEGVSQGYFVKDQKGKAAINSWWAGENSGSIDVTNPDAVAWWTARLRKLQTEIGIDAFKFDAGEVNWLPYSRDLSGDDDLSPNYYTTKYIEAIEQFGGLVEGRAARLSQEHPIFMRMLDKGSHWGYDNGLKSMIPTALQFGIVGYPFVLPDMIGGNAYGEWPSKELYIRWLQVNIFMPSVQFSIVPWDDHFDTETVVITKWALDLRETYKQNILNAARQAVEDGSPINRPIWWVDPTDPVTFTIDQAYMLGDSIMVAPVVEEGARSRDIYLPRGNWMDGVLGTVHTGPLWLRDYSVPLEVVPYFINAN